MTVYQDYSAAESDTGDAVMLHSGVDSSSPQHQTQYDVIKGVWCGESVRAIDGTLTRGSTCSTPGCHRPCAELFNHPGPHICKECSYQVELTLEQAAVLGTAGLSPREQRLINEVAAQKLQLNQHAQAQQ